MPSAAKKVILIVAGLVAVASKSVGQEAQRASSSLPVETPAPGQPNSEGERRVNWSKVPPLGPRPRPGLYTFRPTGPGYYQLLDLLGKEYREQAPPEPFGIASVNGTPSYEYDFRFLENPENTYHPWSSVYKRVHFGDEVLFSAGGELRYRFNNSTGYQLSGKNDTSDLTRMRAYGDLWYRDEVRVFAELLDARIFNQDLPPAASDRTGTDLLNAFLELKACDLAGSPVQVRAGRQEINLGSQRLVASPDFGNTLRTFDGVRGYWYSPKWSVDALWVRPVIPNANRFDSSDDQRAFRGAHATHRPNARTSIECYVFNLSDTRPTTRGDTTTFGGRLAGDVKERLLYDFEAAAQTGTSGGRTVSAQMAAAGLGWHFADLPGNVSFWTCYDYASGTPDPSSREVDRTFNQLFGGNHYYLGYLDLVGRQNLHHWFFQMESNPQPWAQLRVQYHVFRLAAARDALYNLAGAPIRRDPTGRAGNEVGDEIDFQANLHLTPHQDVLLGYSRFFAGNFVRATGPGQDAQYFYVQYSFRF